jgi:hypothetical protein
MSIDARENGWVYTRVRIRLLSEQFFRIALASEFPHRMAVGNNALRALRSRTWKQRSGGTINDGNFTGRYRRLVSPPSTRQIFFAKETPMKKTLLSLAAVVIPLAMAMAYAGDGLTGNNAPSGSHYNLNLLGKDHCPGDDLKDSNRHNIVVLLNYSDPDANNKLGDTLCAEGNESPDCLINLDKRNKIFLGPGEDFQVTDGNACDGDGAELILPYDVATAWEIYIRELGTPGGSGDIRTCGIDVGPDGIEGTDDDEIVCSTNNVELRRTKGKSLFRNETDALTTIVYCIPIYDEFGVEIGCDEDTALLFDEDFYRYFWDYDNNGLRLIQLRFYPVPVE